MPRQFRTFKYCETQPSSSFSYQKIIKFSLKLRLYLTMKRCQCVPKNLLYFLSFENRANICFGGISLPLCIHLPSFVSLLAPTGDLYVMMCWYIVRTQQGFFLKQIHGFEISAVFVFSPFYCCRD